MCQCGWGEIQFPHSFDQSWPSWTLRTKVLIVRTRDLVSSTVILCRQSSSFLIPIFIFFLFHSHLDWIDSTGECRWCSKCPQSKYDLPSNTNTEELKMNIRINRQREEWTEKSEQRLQKIMTVHQMPTKEKNKWTTGDEGEKINHEKRRLKYETNVLCMNACLSMYFIRYWANKSCFCCMYSHFFFLCTFSTNLSLYHALCLSHVCVFRFKI